MTTEPSWRSAPGTRYVWARAQGVWARAEGAGVREGSPHPQPPTHPRIQPASQPAWRAPHVDDQELLRVHRVVQRQARKLEVHSHVGGARATQTHGTVGGERRGGMSVCLGCVEASGGAGSGARAHRVPVRPGQDVASSTGACPLGRGRTRRGRRILAGARAAPPARSAGAAGHPHPRSAPPSEQPPVPGAGQSLWVRVRGWVIMVWMRVRVWVGWEEWRGGCGRRPARPPSIRATWLAACGAAAADRRGLEEGGRGREVGDRGSARLLWRQSEAPAQQAGRRGRALS